MPGDIRDYKVSRTVSDGSDHTPIEYTRKNSGPDLSAFLGSGSPTKRSSSATAAANAVSHFWSPRGAFAAAVAPQKLLHRSTFAYRWISGLMGCIWSYLMVVVHIFFPPEDTFSHSKQLEEQTAIAFKKPRTIWAEIKFGNYDAVVKLVAEDDKCLYERGEVNECPIHFCFLYNQEKHRMIANYLLDNYPAVASHTYGPGPYEGESCLHMAIINKDLEMCMKLVQIDRSLLDVRAVGPEFQPGKVAYYGEFPLMFAACSNQADVVDFLIGEGAQINCSDTHGNTVFHVLVVHAMEGMYDYLQDKFRELNDLSGDEQNETCPWTWPNVDGLSPFTLAAWFGHKSMFTHLLAKKSKVEWSYGPLTLVLNDLEELDSSSMGKSALQLLVEREHIELLTLPRVVDVLNKKWEHYAERKFNQRLVVITSYLILFTFITIADDEEAKEQPLWHLIGEAVIALGALHKGFTEMRELVGNGFWGYFWVSGSMFLENSTSMTYSFCVIVATICRFLTVSGNISPGNNPENAFLMFAAIAGWSYMLFFFLGFRTTGPFVVMISKMLVTDVRLFGQILGIFVMGFSTASMRMFPGSGWNQWLEHLKACFMTMLGGFDFDQSASSHYPTLSVFVLVCYVILVSILLLNLLIAMMGDTYARVTEDANNQWHLEWARIIFAIENEMSEEERNSPRHQYWKVVDGKRYMQVQEEDPNCFKEVEEPAKQPSRPRDLSFESSSNSRRPSDLARSATISLAVPKLKVNVPISQVNVSRRQGPAPIPLPSPGRPVSCLKSPPAMASPSGLHTPTFQSVDLSVSGRSTTMIISDESAHKFGFPLQTPDKPQHFPSQGDSPPSPSPPKPLKRPRNPELLSPDGLHQGPPKRSRSEPQP